MSLDDDNNKNDDDNDNDFSPSSFRKKSGVTVHHNRNVWIKDTEEV